MRSPTGIIAEDLMVPNKKRAVIDFLMAQPYTADMKRSLLLGWAVTVGMRLQRADYAAVERSGVDWT